ncbi:hypothetical protein H6G54_01240 [Anabaena cylindrica FACHB-243]|uniref:Uncharacterized protein n=1 Tax=Anabaena cylindrica (strain ATCC 27899 / PCC 7122) TaxID=272123 RepID=K9ZHC9_ANACC|nr:MULTISPECIES: hypothetical protein [Anabaena]AFZ58596.1 hypothetical protein Anacy_3186 [Anabaena cylindrica PCC 7122]MBD2416358.1 hypothetical protein [Anabaena cylindrica FACHB-243]MBY5285654.1 hypothetical protein [Anabaena sp. CCAP 1446/1C]MBY5311737.1 hypothetical protein [Anabaena sp. CCAP 1446/1C]MCM2407262.1 hypothetical protein [Anabaena sp. CCAP 1446/1C]
MDNFSFLTQVFPSVDIFIGFKPALKRNTKGKTVFSFFDADDNLIGSRVLKEARGLKKLAVPSITEKIHIKSFNEDYYFADVKSMIEDCIKDKIAYVKRDYGLTPEEYYQEILESRAKASLIKEAALKLDKLDFPSGEELEVKYE